MPAPMSAQTWLAEPGQMTMHRMTTIDPQLARALAGITLPSFEELVALTHFKPRPETTRPPAGAVRVLEKGLAA